jgi:hypothetical protein
VPAAGSGLLFDWVGTRYIIAVLAPIKMITTANVEVVGG